MRTHPTFHYTFFQAGVQDSPNDVITHNWRPCPVEQVVRERKEELIEQLGWKVYRRFRVVCGVLHAADVGVGNIGSMGFPVTKAHVRRGRPCHLRRSRMRIFLGHDGGWKVTRGMVERAERICMNSME